ncbi:FAD-dependent oxidoreductase [Jiangella mangrovi]|uniref:Ribulose 1,5-bisphosphate synthetase/thiazole synthase n=1 Tax=Jiangella mangrovi TaxID=1524084 RepID=A0A7W9GPU9_9ACTN|nr:FAD-dependent oxidoreductase [Jiangella mangrovi]MBB5787849.1 ribulose 1,5-bisphosphate synthetase/thiazole synthase [Jiangella mangrovi]
MTSEPALPGLRYYLPPSGPPEDAEADVVVYGATSGGVTAAVRAARDGLSVVLLVFGDHVGGMTTGGLGTTDVGDARTVGGLARAFYDDVAAAYRAPAPHWDVEAHVGEEVLEGWLAEAGVAVHRRRHLESVRSDGGRLTELRTDDGSTYRAKVYVDASYEGDLLAAAGVTYRLGREASTVHDESVAGVQHSINHQFRYAVDPYVVPGRPSSGLLPGISADPYGTVGDGDRRIQAYNFRLHVTTSAKRLPFPRPDGYDPARYELLRRYVEAGGYELYGRTTRVRGDVHDMNNHGAFSSDHIGANYDWPEAGYARREEIFQDHVRYQAGLLHFLATDPRLPAAVRDDTNAFGLAPGEFADTSHWPAQLYIREARRMVSDYVITQHDATGAARATDPVALASYVMDSHNAKRVLVDGQPRNEGNVQQPLTRPFGVSYRALAPKAGEAPNLLVASAISASHVAFASARMEPVFMMLGEVVGAAAGQAITDKVAVQDIEYAALRRELELGGAILPAGH